MCACRLPGWRGIGRVAAPQVSIQSKDHCKGSDDDKGGAADVENSNQGKLIIDATCTPADITFPTDLKILDAAKEKANTSSMYCTDLIMEKRKSLALIEIGLSGPAPMESKHVVSLMMRAPPLT